MKKIFSKNSFPVRRYLVFLKGLLFLFLLNFIVIQASAQEGVSNTGWVLDKTVYKVDCYHMVTTCGKHKVVFLKFNNKNSAAVKVSWKEVFVTQQKTGEKVEGPFREKQLLLSPGETVQTGCNDRQYQQLLARPDQTTPVYQAQILKFNFQDIKVSL